MKRAEVWRIGRVWSWLTYEPSRNRAYARYARDRRIAGRTHPIAGAKYSPRDYPTYAEALSAALAEVGLTTPPEHKEPS